MKVIIIFIFTLCLISGQIICFEVSGCTGGSLMIKCLYENSPESDDQHKGAYFCRDRDCNTGITTELQQCWTNNGRFSLYDDGNSRFITVFIRNLSREDQGEYTCGNQRWKHEVELQVNSESRCGTSVVQNGYIGKTISFHCEYEQEFQTLTKVVYRLNGGDPELMMDSDSRSSRSKSILLSDSQRDHFTVTIKNVSEEDNGGVYLCGVERPGSPQSVTHTTFIKEIRLNIYNQINSVQVQADSGTSVFIKCKFPEEFKKNSKFLQKGESQQIFTEEQNRWERRDKVQMFDDTSEGVLKVFITDLTPADEGAYRCGVQKDDDDLITEVKLEVKQVDHFPASTKVSAVIGESVSFTCTRPLNPRSISHVCRQKRDDGICEGLSPSQQTRVQISESPAGETSVSFSNVRDTDAGVYWCGAETTDTHLTFISLSTRVQLNLIMVGREGDSVQIRCPYDPKPSREVKFLCKGTCFTEDEDAQIVSSSEKTHVNDPNISVNDDTVLGLFTVNLTDLRTEDAGGYCCNVIDQFNLPIELMIIRKDVVTAEASVGGSVSISCKHSTDQSLRVFCRGDQPNVCVRDGVKVKSDQLTNERFSMTDRSSFTVNISRLTAEDSGKYWCAEERSGSFIFTPVHLNVTREKTTSDNSTENKSAEIQPSETSSVLPVIAVVSVGLILLTVCLALLLFKRKHSRKQASDASPDRRDTADTQDPASTALYSAVQSPSVPSDGLMYAAVSFQKNEESVSDAKVTLNKEEIHCEYASVNHGITD